MRKISGIAINEDLYQQVTAARDRGAKVSLTRPEVVGEDDPEWMQVRANAFCVNCHGAGSIGVQIITGGPFNHVPQTDPNSKVNSKGNDDPGPRATFIDGSWYLQKTRGSACPVCNGTGAFTQMPESNPRVVF